MHLFIKYCVSVCLILALGLAAAPLSAQPKPTTAPKPASPTTAAKPTGTPPDENFMYIIGMQIKDMKDISLCYSTQNDIQRVKINYGLEDTINRLDDFVLMEDAMATADCFVPEIKLIFKNYTYVMSMYCTSVMMFKNSAPFTPSATKMKSDLVFTESIYQYLYKIKQKHFKTINILPSIMDKVKLDKVINIEEDTDSKELEALLKEDEEEEEAKDKEIEPEDKGEFDKIEIEEKDPEITD